MDHEWCSISYGKFVFSNAMLVLGTVRGTTEPWNMKQGGRLSPQKNTSTFLWTQCKPPIQSWYFEQKSTSLWVNSKKYHYTPKFFLKFWTKATCAGQLPSTTRVFENSAVMPLARRAMFDELWKGVPLTPIFTNHDLKIWYKWEMKKKTSAIYFRPLVGLISPQLPL